MISLLFKTAVLLTILVGLLWVIVTRPTFTKTNTKAPEASQALQQRLEQHVKKLSIDFVPRSYADIDNLNATADYIKNEFLSLGYDAQEQVFNDSGSEFKNIVVDTGPADAPAIVIGAHYDACDEFPAADDNASGIAGLIELARLLKTQPNTPHIILVAYTLEEPPYFGTELMGSYIHAASLRQNKAPIQLMISLEMIGYYSDEPNSQTFPLGLLKWFYPTEGNYIAVVDRLLSKEGSKLKRGLRQHMRLPVHSVNAPTFIPGVDFSDHRNYWAHDYPAVMLTNTAFYRNMAYHTPHDTYDRLDYNKMGQLITGLANYLTQ